LIWSGYAEQIQEHFKTIDKGNRKSVGFILQQVAGHINKRARHKYTDDLQAGLIDFLNQFINPKLDDDEVEVLRAKSYKNDSKFQINAPSF
jgi:hypothetical protein